MQALYEVDTSTHTVDASLATHIDSRCLPAVVETYARELVEGVFGNLEQIDDLISTYAPSWPVNQLAAVDRNVLRVAIFEIISGGDTPPKVAVNEAVELAKGFGSESSPKFINGVLGSVLIAQNIEV